MISAWRSLPFSISVSGPSGYGPGSLSLAYWKVTDTVACVWSTTLKGNPYGGPPKSGWSLVVDDAIDASHWVLCPCTGSVEMSVFQMLSAGKTWQFVVGGAAAATGRSAASPTPNVAIARSEIRAIVRPIALSKTR